MFFDTLSQVFFKYAAIHAFPPEAHIAWLARVFGHLWVYGSIMGYLGSFVTYMTLLKHAPIGPAFAASHLEVVTVMLASMWLFHEHISLLQSLGAVLIIAGIVCLAISETSSENIDRS